ncbi:MAG: ATP-binding protein, partial [Cyanobacteria bacterium J06648_11]
TVWGRSPEAWHRDPQCWRQAIHPEDRDRVLALISESGDREWNAEYRIIRPDGAIRLICDRAFPIHDDAGQVYRMAGIAEDITERHQAQQGELRALERLAEIGELAASVVHEVRNPLTTVVMGLTSVRQMSLSDRADMRLDLALDEADRLRRLLDEILLYAKPRDLNHEPVELCELLAEILPGLRTMPSAQNREIAFVDRLSRASILGDADKLKQVFINLVDNACEAVPEGDLVTCHIEPGISSKWIVVRVHNGGEPIPPDVLSELTKPFFTTKSSGNGLGLAIVQRIIESHGGELVITSEPEAGTTVTVQFPLMS